MQRGLAQPRCGVAWCGVVWCGVVWCGVGSGRSRVSNGRGLLLSQPREREKERDDDRRTGCTNGTSCCCPRDNRLKPIAAAEYS